MTRRAAWFAVAVLAVGIAVAVAFGWELGPSLVFASVVDLIVWEVYDVCVLALADRRR